jgi:hypothetical protein
MKNLINIIIILISVSLASCKGQISGPLSLKKSGVDAAFKPYLAMFLQEAKKYGKTYDSSKISITFTTKQSSEIGGICYMGTGVIEINESNWNAPSMDIENREAIIFHELGHCLMNIYDHNDHSITTTDGYPMKESLMATVLWNGNGYLNNRETYIKNLFTGANLPASYTLIPQSAPSFPYDFYNNYR